MLVKFKNLPFTHDVCAATSTRPMRIFAWDTDEMKNLFDISFYCF